MNYYTSVRDFFDSDQKNKIPDGLRYATVNTFNSINIPYNQYLLPSNSINRNNLPGPGTFGTNPTNQINDVIEPLRVIGNRDTQAGVVLDKFLLNPNQFPNGYSKEELYSDISLQDTKPPIEYKISQNKILRDTVDINNIKELPPDEIINNYFVNLASESLHVKPDTLMYVFFSDDNINHLRNVVVQKVQEITAESGVAGNNEGITIQPPNMEDFFYYMVNIFQNYKIYNGSICFVNLKNKSALKSEISKLNTNILQEYISKMISQINMYIYYYRDASQIPEQLSQPVYTSTRSNNKTLEYNIGFKPGNSIGMARYNEVGNI